MVQMAIKSRSAQSGSETVVSPDQLMTTALHLYDKSTDEKTSNALTVKCRGQAQQMANVLLEPDSTRVRALNLLGRIALDEGFYNKAGYYLEIALDTAPNDPSVLFSAGHYQLAIKDYDQAVSLFRKAIELGGDQTRASVSLAYTLFKMGRSAEAFNAYRELVKRFPKDKHVQHMLMESADKVRADEYSIQLENDLLSYFNIKGLKYSSLANLACSLLSLKYGLDKPHVELNLSRLANDPLLIASLNKMLVKNATFENFICRIRRRLFTLSLSQSNLDDDHLPLVSALGHYAVATEFALYFDQQERTLLQSLENLMTTVTHAPEWKPSDLAGAAILYAMYLPLHELTLNDAMVTFGLNDWPEWSQALISRALFDFHYEQQHMKRITSAGNISDDVSLRVKSQYEKHPYPRWLHLSHNTPTHYGRALEQEFAQFRAPDFFNQGTIDILIAGCGTGQHAIRVARYFRNVRVLAIDLSKRSLAYAQMMADKYKVTNIEFMQADILNLSAMNRQFHVIECSGVLHHMADPLAGWESLNRVLIPGGLMKVGLYSRRARDVIVRARDIINRNQLESTDDHIRLFRRAILEGSDNKVFDGILTSPDFYNISGCRDLLFHEHEVHFDPLELQEMIGHMAYKFIGFVVDAQVRQKFDTQMDGSGDHADLEAWNQFEQENPNTFSGMFQFYCQKPKTPVH